MSSTVQISRSLRMAPRRSAGNRGRRRSLLGAARVGVGLGLLAAPAQAQVTFLHSFSGSDGKRPLGALVQGSDGNFYGTTSAGGTCNAGSVFRLTPAGQFTLLHLFDESSDCDPTTASVAAGLAVGPDGNFYGVRREGGAHGYGTVFRITPSGEHTTLHSFDPIGTQEGGWPSGRLLLAADGNFYGTTSHGGDLGGWGTVFSVPAGGGPASVVASFAPGGPGAGVHPIAGLIEGADGALYGTASRGGVQDHGAIYRVTAAGALTMLHEFTDDGWWPSCELVLGPDGNFYGTTRYGGANGQGTVFRMIPAGEVTVLHTFGPAEAGLQPFAALVLGPDGNFYGTTRVGGLANGGTLFRITPDGGLTVLYSFGSPTGYYPSAALILGADGDFYGTTEAGGASFAGTVFRFKGPHSAPDNLTATPGNGQVQLGWSGEPAAISYDVYQSTTPSDPTPALAQSGVTGTATTVTGLTNGITYYFTVRAVYATGTSGSSNEASATPFAPLPTVAIVVSPNTIDQGQSATLQWTSSNATSCTAAGAWSGSKPLSGSDTVSPQGGTFTYELTCDGDGGSATASATLTVRDTTPDPFSFTPVTGAPRRVLVTSNAITVSGINVATAISITGGTYSIDGGAFTSAPGTITNGASVRVQVLSARKTATTKTAILTIGSLSGGFSVTTAGRR